MAEPLIETRTPDQLPRVTAISPDALVTVQEEGGPVGAMSVKQLLGRLVQTDTAKETRADLLAELDHDEASVGLVFADPDPAKNGWYRKVGVSGGGTWTQFEKLSAFAAAEIAEYVTQASDAAEAAVAAADVTQALINFRTTRAAGVADFPIGAFFSSNETGELRIYLRTAIAPYYVDQGDSAAPLTKRSLTTRAGGGAALPLFWQDDPGSADRPSNDKMRERVSVFDFPGADLETCINKAIEHLDGAGGGDLFFPRGAYHLSGELTITGKSNIRFVGDLATIDGEAARSYFNFDGCSNIAFEGLRFDARFGELPTFANYAGGPRQVPIRFFGSTGLRVERCVFENLYTRFIDVNGSADIDVTRCRFTSPLQDQNLIIEFLSFLSVSGAINIVGNRFIGATTTVNGKSPAAVGMSGIQGEITIEGNRAWHCGRNNEGAHRLGVFDIYSDAANITVRGNRAWHCREQFMRVSTCVDVLVEANVVTIAAQADPTYSSLLVESGSWPMVTNPVCRRVRIRNNNLRCLGNKQAFALGLATYDWGAGAEDIEFSGNIVRSYERCFSVAGPFQNVRITRNTARDVGIFLDAQLMPGGFAALTTTLGVEADARFDGLRIEDNEAVITAASAFVPISISTSRAPSFTGIVGDIFVRRNRLACSAPGANSAINVIFNAPAGGNQQGDVVIEDNSLTGYSEPFYLRLLRRALIERNVATSVTTRFVTADSTPTNLEMKSNRRSVRGPLSGQAPLIAGTRTISTAEVMAGDRVRVWREVAGGTQGHLSCNPANHVAGTSIRIDSSDVADTSTVGWEIVGR